MGFTVPATLPALSPYLVPPNAIRGDALDTLLKRDRFLFATRRRLIFSGGNFTTTATTYVTPFFFAARTSSAVTGRLWSYLMVMLPPYLGEGRGPGRGAGQGKGSVPGARRGPRSSARA